VIEEELEMRTNEISVAGKAGIKNLCILLNERRFRTKRWETFWGDPTNKISRGDPNYLITKQDVENDLTNVIETLTKIYFPQYNSPENVGNFQNKIAVAIMA
jgi:hypothetical protein